MKADEVYGAELGTIVESQASQLWLVIARGNVESMPALSMGTSDTPCSKYILCNPYGQRQPFFYIIPSAKSLNLAGGFCKTPFGRLVGLENG